MSALRSDHRQPARYNVMLRASRPALRPVPFDLDLPPAQALDEDDLPVPWLTVYADEDEPGSDDEMLLEPPERSQRTIGTRGA